MHLCCLSGLLNFCTSGLLDFELRNQFLHVCHVFSVPRIFHKNSMVWIIGLCIRILESDQSQSECSLITWLGPSSNIRLSSQHLKQLQLRIPAHYSSYIYSQACTTANSDQTIPVAQVSKHEFNNKHQPQQIICRLSRHRSDHLWICSLIRVFINCCWAVIFSLKLQWFFTCASRILNA